MNASPPKYISSSSLPKPEQQQTTQCNEASQNNPIPPLLRPNPLHQPIDTRNLRRRTRNPPLYAHQTFPLYAKILVYRIRLAEHRVRHIVAIIYTPSLIQHVVCLGSLARAVGTDVCAHIGEEICAIAGCADCGFQPGELGAVLLEDLSMSGKVCGFQGGGGGFGVEDT